MEQSLFRLFGVEQVGLEVAPPHFLERFDEVAADEVFAQLCAGLRFRSRPCSAELCHHGAQVNHVLFDRLQQNTTDDKGKGKVFPYSLPSVGPGADPGVQAVSPQVT